MEEVVYKGKEYYIIKKKTFWFGAIMLISVMAMISILILNNFSLLSKWTIFSPIISSQMDMINKNVDCFQSYQEGYHMEQKIKQVDGNIGENIRKLRLEAGLKQTELVGMLQLHGVSMTRETLVKIERGIHHLTVTQLRAIRDCLNTTYDELLK